FQRVRLARAEAPGSINRFAHCFGNVRVTVAENQRPKALTEIDVFTTVHRSQFRAVCATKEDWRTTDAFERAHRTMDAARRDSRRAFEEFFMERAGRAERRRRFGCLACSHWIFIRGDPKRCRRFALPPHSKLDSQLLPVTRTVRDDVLRAGAFEDVPRLQQGFFKLNQSLLS